LLLLPLGVLLGVLYGKAAIYGLVGRTLSNDKLLPPLAVLAGAVPFRAALPGSDRGNDAFGFLFPCSGWVGAVMAMFNSEKKDGFIQPRRFSSGAPRFRHSSCRRHRQ